MEQVEATQRNNGNCHLLQLQGEGHISKQCTMPKRKRDETWFNDKVLLVQAQASGQVLTEEEIAFLADPGLPDTQTFQRLSIPLHNVCLSSDDLDAYDSMCDELTLQPSCSHGESFQEWLRCLTDVYELATNVNSGISKCQLKLWTICADRYKEEESKPKLYDGNVILKMDAIVIPDTDETLMLCEESHSKMLLKEQDPMVVKHKVNTKPINYAVLNNDYNKRFVRQSDLYSEHAYWKATLVPPLDPYPSSTTNKVEVPKELPKVSIPKSFRNCFSNICKIVALSIKQFDPQLLRSHEEKGPEKLDPQFCTHKILMKENAKPVVQHQRRVNPKIHEVIEQEVIKLLDAGLIYPISDSPWMLERLAGNEYYCFLDGFSGYFQIPIDPLDQEKTTFTSPYGTFSYRRMPFGLYNAPGTFQRCMVAIFHDMIEKTMEVFMDNFSVFGDSFSSCLSHLDKMLQRNWEKCHFMVKEGIVLGHKISKSGIEVDKAKVDVIAKLPHPTTVKGIRSFLGHAGFYR
ncbi:reverse transcriptase domain-containing protein [Tanacetum coccineum]